jgi:hypothetical protein
VSCSAKLAALLPLACLASTVEASPPDGGTRVVEIGVTGLDDDRWAETLVLSSLASAGFSGVVRSDGDGDAAAIARCATRASCIARWGRAHGAVAVVRAEVVQAGARATIAIEVTDVAAATRHVVLRGEVAIGIARDEGLVSALAAVRPDGAAPAGPLRKVGWTLAGAAAVLGAGALFSYVRASSIEEEFRDHLDAGGDVSGITPGQAATLEERARRWSLIGAVLLVAGGASATAGTILLVWPDDEGATAGIGGSF